MRHKYLFGGPSTIVCGWLLTGLLAFPDTAFTEPMKDAEAVPPQSPTYAFINGQWFDGHTFAPNTFYSVNGTLTSTQPQHIDHTIDLQNGYVVPPFGEAHTHNVEGEWNIDQVIHHYVRDGIFYVKNPNDIPEFVEHIRHKINKPDSIDVVFAHAGLTSPNGHPIGLYEDMLRIHRYEPVIGQREKGWFDGRAYFSVSTMKDVKDQWPAIMATKPDFLKIYLADSGHFGTHTQPRTTGFRDGLNPRLIAPIVQFAHQQGLRVTAHIETAADFRIAVQGNVDEIAHLPGWFLPSPAQHSAVLLTEEDAKLAATNRTVVVTTTVAQHFHPAGHHQADSNGSHHSHPTSEGHEKQTAEQTSDVARDIQRHNLRILHQAGVTIAIGSDHAETALAEALHLHQLRVFDNLTLLKMWCETTPQTIFPSRKIGRLDEGYEANFLVLKQNPLKDFRHVQDITFRFKQGIPLAVSDSRHAETPHTPH
ncbi:MAG: amidohydrolase family protein [Nitrospirales bacterium]|nr:amidohydrolase family protein [Nitrospirales bacterium]